MQNAPPLIYGVNGRKPPNQLTLVVFQGSFALPIPVVMHFPVLPESYRTLKRYLATVTPTKDGGWVDDYGPAPSPVSLKGTFGRNTKSFFKGGIYNGFGWTKYLEWLADLSHKPNFDGKMPVVWLMVHATQDYFEINIDSFEKFASIARVGFLDYELKATILRPIDGAAIIDDVLTSITKTVVRSTARLVGSISDPALSIPTAVESQSAISLISNVKI